MANARFQSWLSLGGRPILFAHTVRSEGMQVLDPSVIESWHAHVYFDASSREAAQALREAIQTELADRMDMGRFHERPVGPHPMWSYQ